MTVVLPAPTTGRALVPEELFTRLVTRIRTDHPTLAGNLPVRVMDQALAFLGACAVTRTPIGPSGIVDIGWHTFILHTRDYRDFCWRIAGHFIDHVPDVPPDDPGTPSPFPDGWASRARWPASARPGTWSTRTCGDRGTVRATRAVGAAAPAGVRSATRPASTAPGPPRETLATGPARGIPAGRAARR